MAAPSLTQELVNRSREEKTEKENEDRIKWTAGTSPKLYVLTHSESDTNQGLCFPVRTLCLFA